MQIEFEALVMPNKPPFDPSAMTDAMKAQAQQIWLAGLGAFSKAQQDGAKAFEKLVHDGISMQRQVQSTAEEKIAEATQRVSQAANQLSERASGQFDRLEGIFEERVAKAMQRMGLPTAQEWQALHERVAALEAALGKKSVAPAARARKTPAKTAPSKKASAKSAPSARKTTATRKR